MAVTIHVRSRRFRCKARRCSQRIFTERLDGLAAYHARKTNRLKWTLLQVGLAVGVELGARLTGKQAMVASPHAGCWYPPRPGRGGGCTQTTVEQ